jgi:hypothetical protein
VRPQPPKPAPVVEATVEQAVEEAIEEGGGDGLMDDESKKE